MRPGHVGTFPDTWGLHRGRRRGTDLATVLGEGGAVLMIATREVTTDRVTLALEGGVIGPWVDELRAVCARALGTHGALTLDLGGVGFIDRAGLALFHELEGRAVRVTNCSPFIAEQLRGIVAR